MPTPITSNITDTALIFEGGGMRAAYTSAVVAEFIQQGLFFDWVAGISAGSSNTCNYVSRDAWRARETFTDFAADPKFGGMRTFVRGQGMFNAEYIYQNTSLPDQALPFDWTTFADNPARINIGSFNATRGEEVVWTRDDLATLPDLMIRVRASSTMPMLMPPVVIDSETYVDGALAPNGGIALDVAQRAGFKKFVVVLTQPRDYVKRPARNLGLFRAHFRRLPSVPDALAARPSNYNRTRQELVDLEASGAAYVFWPDSMPIGNGERNVAKLRATHELGLAQIRRELPAIREFVGL